MFPVEQHAAVVSYDAKGKFSTADVSWSAAEMARYANVVCDCAADNFMSAPDGNAMSIQLTMRMVVPYNICDGATRAECGMKRKFPETLTSQYKICGSGELKKKQISMVYGEWCTTLEWKTFTADFAPLDQEGDDSRLRWVPSTKAG